MENDPPALLTASQTLTRSQLAAASGKAANLIQNLGLSRGDAIVFGLQRRPELVIGLLGALRFGAVPRIAEPGDFGLLPGARMAVVEAEDKPAIDAVRRSHPDLWHVVVVVRSPAPFAMGAGDFLWDDYYAPAPERFETREGSAPAPALVAPWFVREPIRL